MESQLLHSYMDHCLVALLAGKDVVKLNESRQQCQPALEHEYSLSLSHHYGVVQCYKNRMVLKALAFHSTEGVETEGSSWASANWGPLTSQPHCPTFLSSPQEKAFGIPETLALTSLCWSETTDLLINSRTNNITYDIGNNISHVSFYILIFRCIGRLNDRWN